MDEDEQFNGSELASESAVGSDQYVVKHDFDEDLTVTIAMALSEIGDVEAADVISDFQRYVDPDALNHLFRPRSNGALREGGPLVLTIEGYELRIFNTGRIEIEPET